MCALGVLWLSCEAPAARSGVTSVFVADSSNSSIGDADARFAARRSSGNLARFILSLPPQWVF